MQANISLHEFQSALNKRLLDKDSYNLSNLYLMVQCGDMKYLLDGKDISEIIEVPELVKPPKVKDWFLGVANVRGELFSIVDYLAFSDESKSTQINSDNYILIVHKRHSSNVGLLANKIIGLIDVNKLQPSSKSVMTDDSGNQWNIIKIENLLSNSKFLQVAKRKVKK